MLPDMEVPEACWPKCFLLGHAIELGLKAAPEFFKQSAVYKAPASMQAPGSHDLISLFGWGKLHPCFKGRRIILDE